MHRSLKFLLLSATRGGHTAAVPCRFGVRDVSGLDRLPDAEADPEAVLLTRALLERVSGDQIAVPDVRSAQDVDILHTIAFTVPALGDPSGWHARFGRELNATDDSRHFTADLSGLPVVEGKHLAPFRVHTAAAAHRISQSLAAQLLDPARTYARSRLGYREVASSTNRLTLIAAIIPAGTVTTHTVFCLKTLANPFDEEAQRYLCGMLNSYVANYLIRLRVTTHVSSSIIDRLPVPTLARESAQFREIAALAQALATSAERRAHARLQALAARAYGISASQFRRILDTFPLVDLVDRQAAEAAFYDIVP